MDQVPRGGKRRDHSRERMRQGGENVNYNESTLNIEGNMYSSNTPRNAPNTTPNTTLSRTSNRTLNRTPNTTANSQPKGLSNYTIAGAVGAVVILSMILR